MGGIGKTELALRYAYSHKPNYPGGIFWIRAQEEIGWQIVNIAATSGNLEPPADWDIDKKVAWCWQHWQKETTLIIFDNVLKIEDIKSFLPPPSSQFRVLLTSRDRFSAPVRRYEIQVLTLENALRLLESFDRSIEDRIARDPTTAAAICEWLGYLPLGLELVGRYLAAKPDLSIATMWERLQSQRLNAKALQAADPNMTATLGVIAAFELSWQELTPVAQEIAARLSLFAPAEILWDFVEDCLSEYDKEILGDLRDEELLKNSLLTRVGEGLYRVHQLLREFYSVKLQEMPNKEDFIRNFALYITKVAHYAPETITLEWQFNLHSFIPHLVEASEFSEYLQESEKSYCCVVLSRFYEDRGQLLQSEVWCKKSLSICESELGLTNINTANALDRLATIYLRMGKYEEVESLQFRALQIRERQLGSDDLEVATSFNNIAGFYQEMYRYEEAENFYLKALAIRKNILGTEHIDVAQTMDNLGLLYSSSGKYEEAEPLHIQSLDIYKKQLGMCHVDTAIAMNNLAELYRLTQRYSEAETLYANAIEINVKSFGLNSLHTASCIGNLALIYKLTQRYKEAEDLYKTSLAIREEILGLEHQQTAMSLNNLARLYVCMNQYVEAENLYIRSLSILDRVLGSRHKYTQGVLAHLVSLYLVTEEYLKIQPLLIKELEIAERDLGTNHPTVRDVRNILRVLNERLHPKQDFSN
jgi:tetratricopeptide (TPR) repeat protein